MYLLPIVIVAAGSLVVCEARERTASLVVLPPLVLGYDELYNDSPETGKAVEKKPARAREPENTIIDTKGRRENHRRMNNKDRGKPIPDSKDYWPERSIYAGVPIDRRRYFNVTNGGNVTKSTATATV